MKQWEHTPVTSYLSCSSIQKGIDPLSVLPCHFLSHFCTDHRPLWLTSSCLCPLTPSKLYLSTQNIIHFPPKLSLQMKEIFPVVTISYCRTLKIMNSGSGHAASQVTVGAAQGRDLGTDRRHHIKTGGCCYIELLSHQHS